MEAEMDNDPRTNDSRREEMKAPDEVTAMVKLQELGWGTKRIARELGCSRNTVKRWLSCGSWGPYAEVSRSRQLDGLSEWLAERFRRHGGNADVLRQELASEKGVSVSLRTVERAVAPLRQELLAEARAAVRFETRPGEQLQIDFGERRVAIGGSQVKVFLFVATLGYYARALILHHDRSSREIVLHPRLHAFSQHWGFGWWRVRRIGHAPRMRSNSRFCVS